jgi:hypothetical protein
MFITTKTDQINKKKKKKKKKKKSVFTEFNNLK